MKKLFPVLTQLLGLLLLLLFAGNAFAQRQTSATLTVATTACQMANSCTPVLSLKNGDGSAMFTIASNSGTVTFDGLGADGVTWSPVPSNNSTAASSATTTGNWQANVGAYLAVRMRLSAAGSAAVAIALSSASAKSGGGGSSAGSGIVQSGLLAEYRMQPTETPAALVDYSGNGNNATGTTGGGPPTIIAGSGGLNFGGNGNVTLPAALNAAQTIQIFYSFDPSGASGGNYDSPIEGSQDGTSVGLKFQIVGAGGATDQPSLGAYHINTYVNNANTNLFQSSTTGTQLLTWQITSGGDNIFFSAGQQSPGGTLSVQRVLYSGTPGVGAQSAGSFALGGIYQGHAAQDDLFFGKMYYAVFYNRVLSQNEIAQNATAIQNAMALRGVVTVTSGPAMTPLSSDEFVAIGDSLSAAVAIPLAYTSVPQFVLSPWLAGSNGPNIDNTACSGCFTGQWATSSGGSWGITEADRYYHPFATRNAVLIWLGTNDVALGGTPPNSLLATMSLLATQRRLAGFRVFVGTMVSRTGAGVDAAKNAWNTALRANWRNFADGLVDVAADASLGADGQFSNTTYFQGDGVHITQVGQYEYVPIFARGVNRFFGNTNFSSATVYASAAPAATAITATSETGNIVTATSALNPPVGSIATVQGVTPSGYNGSFTVLTTSGPSFTYSNPTSGLGAGTVFGTAKVPLQQDADTYSVLNFGTGNFTLETCVGYTGQNIYIKNVNGSSSTVVPQGTETIDGAASVTIASKATLILQSFLTSPTAGGCSWKQLQNG